MTFYERAGYGTRRDSNVSWASPSTRYVIKSELNKHPGWASGQYKAPYRMSKKERSSDI